MQLGARCQVAGADFVIPSPIHTMLRAAKPVIAVTAVRTGCGKSQMSKYITNIIRDMGKTVVLVR